jgi:hypothetical protein
MLGAWLQRSPAYSRQVRRLLRKSPLEPSTSISNDSSDLSRGSPRRIVSITSELGAGGNPGRCWIAYRTCHNLLTRAPEAHRTAVMLAGDQVHRLLPARTRTIALAIVTIPAQSLTIPPP